MGAGRTGEAGSMKQTWRYRLDKPFRVFAPELIGVLFKNRWLSIRHGELAIDPGYAWEGCSPSIPLFSGLWVGTWDGPVGSDGRPVTWRASLVHESSSALSDAAEAMREQMAMLGMRFAEHKTSVAQAESGIDFVGHVIRPFRRSGRAKTHRNALLKLESAPKESLSQSCNSYIGLSRHAGSRAQTVALCQSALRRGLSVDFNLTRSFPNAH